jgi:outer membrane protein TolC
MIITKPDNPKNTLKKINNRFIILVVKLNNWFYSNQSINFRNFFIPLFIKIKFIFYSEYSSMQRNSIGYIFNLIFFIINGILSNITQAETLEQAWNQAFNANHSIRAANAQTQAADQELYAAEGQNLPSINIDTSYTQLSVDPAAKAQFAGGQNAQFPTAQSGYFKSQALISIPVYSSDQINSNIRAAQANLNANYQNELTIRLTLKKQIADIFLTVLRTEGHVIVAKKHIDSLKNHYQEVQHLFEQGVVARNDLLAAGVEQANAEQQLLQFSTHLEIAKANYNQLLNRPLNTKVELQLPPQILPKGGLNELNHKALETRPELTVLTQQLQALTEQARSLQASLLPQISLNGGYKFEENRYQAYQGMWLVNLALQWKLFDGSTQHKAESLLQQANALNEQRENLISLIHFEIRQAWLTIQETQRRLKVTRQAIVQANENLQVAKDRYHQGLATNTEVLKAEDLHITSHDNHNTAVYDAIAAILQMRYTIGIL